MELTYKRKVIEAMFIKKHDIFNLIEGTYELDRFMTSLVKRSPPIHLITISAIHTCGLGLETSSGSNVNEKGIHYISLFPIMSGDLPY